MNRCILVSKRMGKNKEKTEDVIYLTLAKLPSKMKDGVTLFYPKKEDLIISTAVTAKSTNADFVEFANALEGCLVDVAYNLNPYTMKPVISSMKTVPGSDAFTTTDLYL